MKTKDRVVAEVCLYGSALHCRPDSVVPVGTGWIATAPGAGMAGDGELRAGRGWTECLYEAVVACRELVGNVDGMVRVFAAGGEFCADTPLAHPGWYGDLKWSRVEQGGFVVNLAADGTVTVGVA